MHHRRSVQSRWKSLLISGLLTTNLVLVNVLPAIAQYRPPRGGSAPTSGGVASPRTGSCTWASDLNLTILAPYSHVGQTAATHPTFSWYVPGSQVFTVNFQLYVYNTDGTLQRNPIYETDLTSTPGVMAWTLPETEPALVVGNQYYWQVALLCDPNHPSEDAIVSAEMQIVETTVPDSERWYDLLKAAIANAAAQPQAILDLLLGLADLEQSAGETMAGTTDVDQVERRRAVLQQSENLLQIANTER